MKGLRGAKLRFAACVRNDGYADDLKLRTVCQVLPDEGAAKSSYLRVIDETGEDYLYPASYFVPITLPAEAARRLTVSLGD